MPTRRSKSEQRETRFFFELIFIILILFSPIFHGSYGLFPLSVIQFGAILLALVWYLALARAKEPQIIYPTQLILLLFFILVVAFQLMPLPVKVLKLLSPETLRLYREYYPNFSNYNLYTLSLYPFSTRNELARNFTYFLIFFVALNAFEKKSSFKKIVQQDDEDKQEEVIKNTNTVQPKKVDPANTTVGQVSDDEDEELEIPAFIRKKMGM